MRIVVATLALVALGSAAFAADSALVEAARREGQVNWYTSLVQNQVARPMAAAFEKAYPGIQVRLVAGTVGELELKITAEARVGALQADVHHGGGVTGDLVRAGLVEPYRPDSAKDFPAAYRDPNGFWTAQVVNVLGPAVNTSLVPEAEVPKTYQDLLHPRWKGKIAWTTQMSQGGPPGFIGTVLAAMGREAGMVYLRALAPQVVSVPTNQRVVLDQVIAGEYPLSLATFTHHVEISAAKGAPVRWLKLDPLTATTDPIFLLKGAPHPNAGKLFIDFVLSGAGQAVFRDAGYIPADPKVPALVPALKPEAGQFRVEALSPETVDKNLAEWVAIYNAIFK